MSLYPIFLLFFYSAQIDALQCFMCRHTLRQKDVNEHLDQHPECLSAEMFSNHSGMRRECTELEPFCSSTVTTINGWFLEVERDCSQVCKPMCSSNGYGLTWTQCVNCCNTSLCNNFEGRSYYENDAEDFGLRVEMSAASWMMLIVAVAMRF